MQLASRSVIVGADVQGAVLDVQMPSRQLSRLDLKRMASTNARSGVAWSANAVRAAWLRLIRTDGWIIWEATYPARTSNGLIR